MDLKSPVRKRRKYVPPHNEEEFCGGRTYSGYFNGTSVVIENPEEITSLYNMGFFGKGSLSRSFPNFGKHKNGIPQVLSERQWKRRKEWEKELGLILKKLPQSPLKTSSNALASPECLSADNKVDNTTESKTDNTGEEAESLDTTPTNEINDAYITERKSPSKDESATNTGCKLISPSEDKDKPETESTNADDTATNAPSSSEDKDTSTETVRANTDDTSTNAPSSSEGKDEPDKSAGTLSEANGVSNAQSSTENKAESDRASASINVSPNESIIESTGKFAEITWDDNTSITSGKDSDIMIIDENDDDVQVIEKVEPSKADVKMVEEEKYDDDVQVIEKEEPSAIDVKMVEEEKSDDDVQVIEKERNKTDVEMVEVFDDDVKIIDDKTKESKTETNAESTEDLEKLVDGKDQGTKNVSPESRSEEQNQNTVLTIVDKDAAFDDISDLNPCIEHEDIKIVLELMHLTLEESFFLNFAFGCLNVCDLSGQLLNRKEMWVMFNNAQPDFIENYIAYHYFRAKGWVVKSGLKYGGNFLLYKDGPPFYHASYIVIIENINKFNTPTKSKTWEEILPFYRTGEASKKEILVCHILWPDDLKGINSPSILSSFKVSETLLRRWLPGQEKEEGDLF